MSFSPPPAQRPSVAQVFARQGFVIVHQPALPAILAKAREHLLSRAAAGTVITDDEQVPGTPAVYGGVVLDGLMEKLRPTIGALHGFVASSHLFLRPPLPARRSAGQALRPRRLRGQHRPQPFPGTRRALAAALQFGHYDVCLKLKAGDALLHPALAMPFAARLSANS